MVVDYSRTVWKTSYAGHEVTGNKIQLKKSLTDPGGLEGPGGQDLLQGTIRVPKLHKEEGERCI